MTALKNEKPMQLEKTTNAQLKCVRFNPVMPTNSSYRRNKLKDHGLSTYDDEDDDKNVGHEAMIFVYGHNVNIYHDVFNIPETASIMQIRESYSALLHQLKTWKDCCIRKSIPDASLVYLTGMPLSQVEAGISVTTYIEIKTDAVRRAYEILADSTSRYEYDEYLKEYLQELRAESMRKGKQQLQRNHCSYEKASRDRVIEPEVDEMIWSYDPKFVPAGSTPGDKDLLHHILLNDNKITNPAISEHENEKTKSSELDSFVSECGTFPIQSHVISSVEEVQCTREKTIFVCSLPNRSRENTKEKIAGTSEDQDDIEHDKILSSSSNEYQFWIEKQENPYDECEEDEECANIEQTLSDIVLAGNTANATTTNNQHDRDNEFEDIKQCLSDTALKGGVGGSSKKQNLAPIDAIDLEKRKKKKKRNRFKFWRRSRATNAKMSRFETKVDDKNEVKFIDCMTRQYQNCDNDTDNETYISFRSDRHIRGISADEGINDDETTITSATSATTAHSQYTTDSNPTLGGCSWIRFIAYICLDELHGTLRDTAIMFKDKNTNATA